MSALDTVSTWLLDTSWQVGLLVIAVLVLERVFGKLLAPRWRYALWLLVVARLAWPAPLHAPGGLPSWEQLAASPPRIEGGREPAARPTPASPVREQPTVPRMSAPRRTARAVDLDKGADSEPAADRDPARSAEVETSDVAATSQLAPAPSPRLPSRRLSRANVAHQTEAPAEAPAAATQAAAPGAATRPAESTWSLQTILLSVWAAGALVLLARSTWHELRFRRALRQARPVTDARIRSLLADAAEALDVRRAIDVLRTDLVAAPAVHGVRHARLLLPTTMPADFDDRSWGCVLRHELAHVAARDVALGLVVTVLRHVFWFHPLVALAARRLSLAQEALRDWQAIAAAPDVTPGLHGRTLLSLAAHTTLPTPTAITAGLLSRRSLEERIHMIARHRPSSPRNAALGLALLLPLGWAGVTVAPGAVDPATTTAAFVASPTSAASDGRPEPHTRQLRVERHRPEPAWRAALTEQLTRPVRVSVESAGVDEVFDLIREQTGVNLVTRQGLLTDWSDPEVTLAFESIAAGDLLDLICRHVDGLEYTLARGVVYVGEDGELPTTAELRFYTVPELFDTHWDDDDDILDLIMDYGSDRESWDELPQVSMEVFGDMLAVSQTPDNHVRIEAFLERLLRGGTALETTPPTWQTELDAALATTTSIDHAGHLGGYAEMLSSIHGVNILVDEEFHEDEVTLELHDVPLRLVLDWLAAFTGLSVVLDHGAVRLTEKRAVTLEMHPIADLLEIWDDDELGELVEEHVAPETWYDDPRMQLNFWRELLVVRQSEAAQAAVVDLLNALRRAKAD